MYFENGYVYGGEKARPIGVVSVRVMPGRLLHLTFNNGEKKIFDGRLLSGGVYERIADERKFAEATVDRGAVVWDGGEIDCAPEFMYKRGEELTEGGSV